MAHWEPARYLCWQRPGVVRSLGTTTVAIFGKDIKALLGHAKSELAVFGDRPTTDLAFVANATSGMNAILRSLIFKFCDELLKYFRNITPVAMR